MQKKKKKEERNKSNNLLEKLLRTVQRERERVGYLDPNWT